MSRINTLRTLVAYVRERNPVESDPITYERAARALADVVERAVEWHTDVDLVYPSQTEQRIRDALREILEGRPS